MMVKNQRDDIYINGNAKHKIRQKARKIFLSKWGGIVFFCQGVATLIVTLDVKLTIDP